MLKYIQLKKKKKMDLSRTKGPTMARGYTNLYVFINNIISSTLNIYIINNSNESAHVQQKLLISTTT